VQATEHIDEALKEQGGALASRVILFAHPAREYNGFAARTSSDGAHEVLLLRWFDGRVDKCELLVAHVCRGARILERAAWCKAFKAWVSYSCELLWFTCTETGERRWTDVLERMAIVVQRRHSARAARADIAAVYMQAIADTWDTIRPEDGDVLNMMYFQKCIDGLEAHDDA
jgi:hypothetical protein